MSDRNIAVVTGTRAEFGLLKSPMEHIRSHEALSLSTVVTGMHLSPQYGNTHTEIKRVGFDIDRKVEMLFDSDSGVGMAKSLGVGISGMAEAFRHLEPDIVLVLGDRDEPFAAAVAAAHMQIPVAHIHGGDVMIGATIDDSLRHALTKFAHIHFPASDESAERIRRLGEEPSRITISGAPGLDDILNDEYVLGSDTCAELGLDHDRPLVLLVQHPVTTQPEAAGEQMQATVDALEKFETQIVLIYPNSDSGSNQIIDIIQSLSDDDNLLTFESLPRELYLGVMDAADVMVGNSSSGIIEAPSFDLPVVDIGPREERRQRTDNTVSVPHETSAIEEAIRTCLMDEEIRQQAESSSNPYDYGGAGQRIADTLATVKLNESLLRKNITY
jgi:UDP-N-acetylglucosamine 2-epimerase (non-hydrolysing)/GDP/UDP-N,N'-diacetylbacillosamine 2-epimerase (hydrolysing)